MKCQQQYSHKLSVAIGLLFILQFSVSYADIQRMTSIYQLSLEELLNVEIVAASGSSRTIREAPAVASVITAERIKAMGATRLHEVLGSIPGLHTGITYLTYFPTYWFRGIFADFNPQALLLINGIPYHSLFEGRRVDPWGSMPVNAIARIEVIRGPGSALHGADAFAGVINIITKTADDIDGTVVGGRVGKFNTREAWLLYGGRWGNSDIAFTLEYKDTDGHGATLENDNQSLNDAFFNTDASLAPGPVNLEQRNSIDALIDASLKYWRLRLAYKHREIGHGVGLFGALDPKGGATGEYYQADITYQNPKFFDFWELNVQFSHQNTSALWDSTVFPPGTDLGFGTFTNGVKENINLWERNRRASVTGVYHGMDNHDIRIGAGYFFGDIYRIEDKKNFGVDPNTGAFLEADSPLVDLSDTPLALIPEEKRTNTYILLQDMLQLTGNLEITTGIRFDHYSDIGDTTNPRIAIVWGATESLTTKFLIGQAFRAPSFVELYNLDTNVSGNKALRPETLTNYELAFEFIPNRRLRLGLNLFYYQWRDKILYVADPLPAPTVDNPTPELTFTAQNKGKQSGKGFEFELLWDATRDLQLDLNYAFQHSIDKETRVKAPVAPTRQLYLASHWQVTDRWQHHLSINWVMDREREKEDSRENISDYIWVDMSVRGQLSTHWSCSLSIQNLLNRKAKEPGMISILAEDLPLSERYYSTEFEYYF